MGMKQRGGISSGWIPWLRHARCGSKGIHKLGRAQHRRVGVLIRRETSMCIYFRTAVDNPGEAAADHAPIDVAMSASDGIISPLGVPSMPGLSFGKMPYMGERSG